MKRIILCVLSSMLCVSMYSQNDAQTHYSVSGGLLGAFNLTEFRTDNGVDYNTKMAWGLGGWVNFPVSKGFSIEPQLQFNSYQFQTRSTNLGLLMYDGKIRFISLPILLKFHAGDHFAITFGPQFDFRTSIEDNNNVANKEQFKGSSVGLSGGLEIFPRGKVTIFGRYILGLTDMDARQNHDASMEYKTSNIQLGLKFRLFGKKETTTYRATTVTTIPDSDGDGITDDVDKCPNQPGIAKYNGCPIPDSDNDGINDEEDKCPNQAGTAKYQGCPIPDSDNDGINDEEDKCPNQAGTVERNGCPVTDRDNDGVDDDHDKCPDIAGTSANNGCPDVPANLSKSIGMASSGISFGTGTNNAKLSTRSNASLDQVVTIMNENPGLKIRVEGHTDNTGNADDAMTLSQNRANAVKDYLVSKGIASDRVIVEGFGGTQPISDNNTAAGRKKNNRIELRMVYY
jgi:outer membrane protein OmpA-like peptidoglycan-associated protein